MSKYIEGDWNMDILLNYLHQIETAERSRYIQENLIPKMAQVALELPNILPCQIPLLSKDKNIAVHLTQSQVRYQTRYNHRFSA
jgi:hypothetical protein